MSLAHMHPFFDTQCLTGGTYGDARSKTGCGALSVPRVLPSLSAPLAGAPPRHRPPASQFSAKSRNPSRARTVSLTPRSFRRVWNRCMGKSHRQYCADRKKFSPKQHRQRIMRAVTKTKQCPLHDLKRNRKCKQADNPNDICAQFQPGRSLCALSGKKLFSACILARAEGERDRDSPCAQEHRGTRRAPRRRHGPPAGRSGH